jgi:hypothetical protein
LDLTSGGTITGNLVVTGTVATGAATLASAVITGAATVGTTLGVTGVTTHSDDISMGAGAQVLLDASNSLTECPLAFVGDVNSGLRRIGADNPGLVANGSAAANWNDSVMTFAVNNTSSGTLTANGVTAIQGRLTIDPEVVKVANYQVISTDVIVIMNGTALTATLVASPTTNTALWIKNVDVGTCTIARNGKTIDGASSDITLISGEAALLFYNGTGWYRLGT